MNFSHAIDRFISDMESQGRLNSRSSVRNYFLVLEKHAEDVGNRDPAYTSREDVKRTLRRWPHPNTQGTNRAKLVAFYRWAMEEGVRKDNPAEQTRRPRRRPAPRRRLTHEEVVALLVAPESRRERWTMYLALCVGLRNTELRGLQGRHFARDGLVWVSADIAKGQRERLVPVTPDLAPIAVEIRTLVADDEYVLPAQRWRDLGNNSARLDLRKLPSSTQSLGALVDRVGRRAGFAFRVTPHALRHAFADHIAGTADTHVAQHLLGHAHLSTTETYLGNPKLDALRAAVADASYGIRTNVLGVLEKGSKPLKATTGIEPV